LRGHRRRARQLRQRAFDRGPCRGRGRRERRRVDRIERELGRVVAARDGVGGGLDRGRQRGTHRRRKHRERRAGHDIHGRDQRERGIGRLAQRREFDAARRSLEPGELQPRRDLAVAAAQQLPERRQRASARLAQHGRGRAQPARELALDQPPRRRRDEQGEHQRDGSRDGDEEPRVQERAGREIVGRYRSEQVERVGDDQRNGPADRP
jgi:hypothetical protein